VQIALAGAVGNFAQQGNYTVYGTPETKADMLEKLSKGLGIGAFLDGVGKSVFGGNGDRTPSETVDDLASMLGMVVKKVTGKDMNISPELAETIAGMVKSSIPAISQQPTKSEATADGAAKKGEGKHG
jgi:hypothetical protein